MHNTAEYLASGISTRSKAGGVYAYFTPPYDAAAAARLGLLAPEHTRQGIRSPQLTITRLWNKGMLP